MRHGGLIWLAAWGLSSTAAWGQAVVEGSDEPSTGEATLTPTPTSAYDLPHNFFGVHLLVGDGGPGTRGDTHLGWARHLVGRWGHAKTLMMGITRRTRGPTSGWVDYVDRCYALELIPFCRLAGVHKDGQWVKPAADGPGDYRTMAQAIRRVIEGLPRSDLCPLYIELWNEPNLAVEWSGAPNAAEYAAFFVQAAEAIHAIGDERIKVLNAGLATRPDWARKLCRADPGFIKAFDLWSCHPYPMNRPPSFNLHDGTVPPGSELTIDAYRLEAAVLAELGREDVKVMITETGYDLGNGTYLISEGHPIINETNRADYVVRAFRDYWPQWPEIVAVFPFEFCNEGWERFDWVYPDSSTNPDGSPSRPHYQYTAVAALAKPTDTTGAISGTVTVDEVGSRLEKANVTVGIYGAVSDPMGNYFLGKLKPAKYTVRIDKAGYASVRRRVEVTAGANAVVDAALTAKRRAELRGVARSGDDGKPLARVTVTLEPTGRKVRSDRRGRFKFQEIIPARYRLVAEREGRCRYEVRDVEVIAGRPNTHDFALGEQRASDGDNMLNNPGMEAGGGGGGKTGIALGFEPTDHGGHEARWASVSQRAAHTGRQSQLIRLRADETVIRQLTHYNTVQPGTRYQAGVWIKTDVPNRDGSAWLTFDFTDNRGAVLRRAGTTKRIDGRSEWTWVSRQGVAPEDAKRLSINLHGQGPKGGMIYFDDAYLGPVQGRR